MNVQVPRGVDWSATYCRPTTHKKPKSRKYQDLNAYFVSSIIASGGRTTVHTSTLRSLFGGDYRRFIERLIENNVISVKSYLTGGNVVESYSVGESAKEYRLINVAGFENYTISEPSTIRQIKKARVKQLRFTLATHPHLRREYDFICSLSFDLEGATRFLRETYKPVDMVKASRWIISNYGAWGVRLIRAAISNDRRTFKGLSKKLKLTGAYRASDIRKLAEDYRALKTRLHEAEKWNLIQASNDKDEYISISYSKRTNRVHSNLTSTPKNIRKFLTLQGEPLSEIDASNCQWALLMSYERFNLKRATIVFNKKVLKTIKETTKDGGGLWSPTTHQHPHTILLHSLEREDASIVALLESGYFRETIHKEAERTVRRLNLGAQRPTLYPIPDEKKTKQRLISRVLFDRPDAPYLKDEVVVMVFKKLFPNRHERIQQLKSTYWREVAGGVDIQDKPYASLAIRLQRMEAEIFHGLFGEIAIPHGVIHDSILVKSSDADQMIKRMRAISQEYNLTLPLSLDGKFLVFGHSGSYFAAEQ
jgi:hypothetical protein